VLAAIMVMAAENSAAIDVLTNNYDDFRTGANLNETVLNVANVKAETFGRLFSYAVDGAVLSQPLVVEQVRLADGSARDVVYVTTLNNSVYAFDAHKGDLPALWQKSLSELPGGTEGTAVGIFSTPVIDRSTQTLYVVAGMLEGSQPRYVLHALDLAHGREKMSGPVLMTGSVKVDSTLVPFDPDGNRLGVQRSALALAKGKVIVAFGGDFFEGWIFSYDGSDLRKAPDVFCTTCVSRVPAISGVDYRNADCTFIGPAGGIWQAGRAPVVDKDGMVYFFTGNKAHVINNGCTIPKNNSPCAACANDGGCVCKGIGMPKVCRGPDTCTANAARNSALFDVNESLIRLDAANGLRLTGWFRPGNWDVAGPNGLEVNDLDLGASGPVMIPGTSRLIGGGKEGVMYVLDIKAPASLCVPALTNTCLSSGAANPIQSFQIAKWPQPPNEYYRHLFGGPVIWSRPADQGGSLSFAWRQNDVLRAYRVTDKVEGCVPTPAGNLTTHECGGMAQGKDYLSGHPGGILTLSSRGPDAASGIVWASAIRMASGSGKLMAFQAVPDAATPIELTKIWDSELCAEDAMEGRSDFIPPTVANGKVYVATNANKVEVFGLIKARQCVQQVSPDLIGPMLQ
jgi:outer membrane protein assembly factor BamB